jgi:hypothetical protein
MDKFFYKNNKEVNLEEVKENPVIPHLFLHKGGTLFYKIQKGKKDPELKGILIRLDSKSLSSSISEIEERKLYKQDDAKAPKRKVEEMKFWYDAAMKLHEALDCFTWGGFAGIKLVNRFSVGGLVLEGKNLYFNPHWVHERSERDIILRLREFIKREI